MQLETGEYFQMERDRRVRKKNERDAHQASVRQQRKEEREKELVAPEEPEKIIRQRANSGGCGIKKGSLTGI